MFMYLRTQGAPNLGVTPWMLDLVFKNSTKVLAR